MPAILYRRAEIFNKYKTMEYLGGAGLIELAGLPVNVAAVQVTVGEPPLVSVVLSSPERLGNVQVDALKHIISERVGEPVLLEAQLNIRR